jgi:rubrerythrin
MPTSIDNLKEAFAGESQANQKYRAFALRAEQDGFPNIARLFRTTAEAERIHAEGHLRALDAILSTAENLKAAIAGETYGYAVKVEAVHAKLYQCALDAVLQGRDLQETKFYLCPVCGHIEFGKPPETCPICGAKGTRFTQV